MNPREPHLYFPRQHGAGCALFGAAVTLVVTLLAIDNLIEVPLSIPGAASCLWLAFVGLYAYVGWAHCGGLAGLGTAALSVFSQLRFVSASAGEFRHGFVLCGREFTLESAPVSSLSAVDWSPGQATTLAGTDQDDWSVALWFRLEAGKREWEQTLWLLGPPQPELKAELFGDRVLVFLREAGVGLRWEGGGHYVTAERSRTGEGRQ